MTPPAHQHETQHRTEPQVKQRRRQNTPKPPHMSPPPLNPLIYASPSANIFILDIPASISHAQHLPNSHPPHEHHRHRTLLSAPALQHPHQTAEPKSTGKLAQLAAQTSEEERARDAEYVALLQGAMEEVRGAGVVEFCCERTAGGFVGGEGAGRRGGLKRKRESVGSRTVSTGDDVAVLVEGADARGEWDAAQGESAAFLRKLACNATSPDARWNLQPEPPSSAPRTTGTGNIIHNTSKHTTVLTPAPTSTSHPAQPRYHLPPSSTALNAPISATPTSLTALLHHASHVHSPPTSTSTSSLQQQNRFTLILLDPPWPNRSARRHSSYTTLPAPSHSGASLAGIRETLLSLDLPVHVDPDGFVGVWVTHKASVRATVMQLFEAWDVEVVEEWVWGKVTRGGEWVNGGVLSGVWRRGWEVLIIGRRKRDGNGDEDSERRRQSDEGVEKPVRRRVVLAVPDVHSRKPCLRDLFERVLFEKHESGTGDTAPGAEVEGARTVIQDTVCVAPVLELFARHMVAGWCSWGDEALKYQWERWWRSGAATNESCESLDAS